MKISSVGNIRRTVPGVQPVILTVTGQETKLSSWIENVESRSQVIPPIYASDVDKDISGKSFRIDSRAGNALLTESQSRRN